MNVLQKGPIKIVEWFRERINMSGRRMAVMRPAEFHIRDNGSTQDLPTVAIVMWDGNHIWTVGEISYSMLKPVIAALDAAEQRQRAVTAARDQGGGQ